MAAAVPPPSRRTGCSPGEYVTPDFPVLSAGPTPHTPLKDWAFSIRQGGKTRKAWMWPEIQALPTETVTVDTLIFGLAGTVTT